MGEYVGGSWLQLPWSVRCVGRRGPGMGEGGSATGYKCWTGDDLGWVQLPNIHVGVGQEMSCGGSSYRKGVG